MKLKNVKNALLTKIKNVKENNDMNKNRKNFVNLCKKTQSEMKENLTAWLCQNYDKVYSEKGYVYAVGSDPILLTAHMDTVHKQTVREVKWSVNKEGKEIVSSPQGIGGDDRCGIYMIKEIIKRTSYKPKHRIKQGRRRCIQ